jgi:hypothetical protein
VRLQVKRIKFIFGAFFIISVLVMNACATTELTSVWKDDKYRGGPLKKMLIIFVIQQEHLKIVFEDELAGQLQETGTVAVPSHTIFPEGGMLDKKMIDAKISELGIDSVLIARLLDVQDAGIYETYPYVSESSYFGYYMLCCQNVSLGYNALIETKVFDAGSDSLIWEALSETAIERASVNIIRSYVPAIIKSLRDQNLLQDS